MAAQRTTAPSPESTQEGAQHTKGGGGAIATGTLLYRLAAAATAAAAVTAAVSARSFDSMALRSNLSFKMRASNDGFGGGHGEGRARGGGVSEDEGWE